MELLFFYSRARVFFCLGLYRPYLVIVMMKGKNWFPVVTSGGSSVFICERHHRELLSFILFPPLFWAAAPKGRRPVGHRGEFPDVHPSICPFFRPSICLSILPSICLSILPSICLSILPSICLSFHPSPPPRPEAALALINAKVPLINKEN